MKHDPDFWRDVQPWYAERLAEAAKIENQRMRTAWGHSRWPNPALPEVVRKACLPRREAGIEIRQEIVRLIARKAMTVPQIAPLVSRSETSVARNLRMLRDQGLARVVGKAGLRLRLWRKA